MEKKIINKFGVHYLLGKDKDGQYVYLEQPSWDCCWYWGGMYLHTFTNNARPTCSKDIASHFHFDSTFLRGPEYAKKMFEDYFEETVLTENEIWILCDYMMSCYTLRKAAELFSTGYSHQIERAKIESIKSKEQAQYINQVLLPELFKKIEELLSSAE
jgi:hypothetical protein